MNKTVSNIREDYKKSFEAKRNYISDLATVENGDFIFTKKWEDVIDFLNNIKDFNVLDLFINVSDFNISKDVYYLQGRVVKNNNTEENTNITEILDEYKTLYKRDDFVIENNDKLSETVVEHLLDMYYNGNYKPKYSFEGCEIVIIKS